MNDPNGSISTLLVDDDATFRKVLASALERRHLDVDAAQNAQDALARIESKDYHVAIVDLKMPGMDGIELMNKLQRERPDIQVIILTGHGTIPSAIRAVKEGASHYLLKPCDVEEVEATIRAAARQSRLAEENARLREAMSRSAPYEGIVGRSPAIMETIELIERTKDSWSPVLILGESGTGKELVARALHASSKRKDRPWVPINCAGLKPELLENELFGHVEGAFTGASKSKRGIFEVADGGTLFIDEIADMNLTIQASLLRVVETGVFRPLGSTREKKVRVRIVAAANRDLVEEVRAGRFRQDLFFRLDIVRITVPPLRERKGDVRLLADHYIANSREARKKGVSLHPEALELLERYEFPGNVRELFGILERAILLSRGGEISAPDIDAVLHPSFGAERKRTPTPITLEETEKRHIQEILEREEWNISRVASLLGIDRRTLQRKMRRYGLR